MVLQDQALDPSRSERGSVQVEAELGSATARAQLVFYNFNCPPDSVLHTKDVFRLELCLNARHRGSRGCFRDQWSPRRFERIGDLFLLPPGFDLIVRSDEAYSLKSVVLQLNAKDVYQMLDKRPGLNDQHLVAALDLKMPKLQSLLVWAAEEVRQPGFASKMTIELLSKHAIIELVRHGHTIADKDVRGGLSAWQLRMINERLQEVREAPTLTELAALCRTSLRQLSRGFRASKGCAIGAYVMARQIEHAKRLLAADHSINFIAEAFGFSSSSNFCVAFRRVTGLTPKQFRETLLRH